MRTLFFEKRRSETACLPCLPLLVTRPGCLMFFNRFLVELRTGVFNWGNFFIKNFVFFKETMWKTEECPIQDNGNHARVELTMISHPWEEEKYETYFKVHRD